jgi:hypothetical protein
VEEAEQLLLDLFVSAIRWLLELVPEWPARAAPRDEAVHSVLIEDVDLVFE